MRAEAADLQERRILGEVMDRVRRALPVDELIGPGVDAKRLVAVLGPAAFAGATIEWIGVNGERVDAVVTAGESQWRIVFGCATGTVIDWLDVFERPARFDGVPGGRTVLINGPSGSGKSTLMSALQHVATAPFVIFDEPEHVGTVQPEYLIWRDRAPALHRGYLDAIAALARAGNQVAVSAGGHRQNVFTDTFGDIPTCTVGLRCALDVLIERERRSGRWAGIATSSPDIHDGWIYDIELDTTNAPDPLALARRVLSEL